MAVAITEVKQVPSGRLKTNYNIRKQQKHKTKLKKTQTYNNTNTRKRKQQINNKKKPNNNVPTIIKSNQKHKKVPGGRPNVRLIKNLHQHLEVGNLARWLCETTDLKPSGTMVFITPIYIGMGWYVVLQIL